MSVEVNEGTAAKLMCLVKITTNKIAIAGKDNRVVAMDGDSLYWISYDNLFPTACEMCIKTFEILELIMIE